MRIYAIILRSGDSMPISTISKEWPVHHVWDERVAFVQNPDLNDTTSDIARKVGISKEGLSGVVIQVDHMGGFAHLVFGGMVEQQP